MARIRKTNIANCKLTFDEVEELAMQSTELPAGLDLINQAVFLALRNIYTAWRLHRITEEQAVREKNQVQKRYTKHRECEQFFRELVKSKVQRSVAATEKQRNILIKLKAGESVERDALECIGLLLGDAGFAATALKRIKEREECGK